MLLDPSTGFEGIFATIERRARGDIRVPEGISPYLLTALGGVSAMIIWLKVGAMLGFREVAAAQFRWSYVVVAIVAGAVIALVAQVLWGYVAASGARVLGRECAPRELRVVWGASAFPQIAALLFLLPLDLSIVGSATFTSERLTDPVATGWAALSIALSISLAVWSAFIFLRGIQVAMRIAWPKAVTAVVVAAACLAAAVTGSVLAARAAAGT